MMTPEIEIKTLDTHTAGMPTRIIPHGSNWVPGTHDSVQQARDAFESESDWIRRLLMQEPRGHTAMYGALVLSPINPKSDLSVFFFHGDGYVDACIHGTIGVVTALIEADYIDTRPKLTIDTPAGTVQAAPNMSEEKVVSVQITNVKSFVFKSIDVAVTYGDTNLELEVPLVYAGNLFALVDLSDLLLDINSTPIADLVELAEKIQSDLNKRLSSDENVPGSIIDHVEFYNESRRPPQNVTIFGNGIVDRSPCGTGTCAKMAYLVSKGDLAPGDSYTYASRIDTEFTGTILENQCPEDRPGILPAIQGSAYLTGNHTFYYESNDPIVGFTMN